MNNMAKLPFELSVPISRARLKPPRGTGVVEPRPASRILRPRVVARTALAGPGGVRDWPEPFESNMASAGNDRVGNVSAST
jgi:hypothetical protein